MKKFNLKSIMKNRKWYYVQWTDENGQQREEAPLMRAVKKRAAHLKSRGIAATWGTCE